MIRKKSLMLFIEIILLIGIISILVGCNNAKQYNGKEFDDVKIENAQNTIYEYYKFHFILIPNECIVFNEEQSTEEKLVFDIYWIPNKTYFDLYDAEDNTEIIDETLYVKEETDVYNVYNESDECVFGYPTGRDRGTVRAGQGRQSGDGSMIEPDRTGDGSSKTGDGSMS